MADDPTPWMETLRNQGVAALFGAVIAGVAILFKNRTSIAVLVTKLDTLHDDLKRIASATETLADATARQDERIKNLEKRL